MSGALPSSRDRNAELLALVADLEVIQHRILDLTNGKIDAVVHPSGILSLLPAAQESLRRREAEQRAFAAERAAILDAIPAQIALLNETGQILVVNKRWLAFGCANGLAADYSSIGKNYLEICESTQADAEQGNTGCRCGNPVRARWPDRNHSAWSILVRAGMACAGFSFSSPRLAAMSGAAPS